MRHFEFQLVLKGPVHIGNGEKYGKKDYFQNGDNVAVLNVSSFIQKLSPEEFESYCSFLQNQECDADLQSFLKRNNLLSKAVKSVAYSVATPLARARGGAIKYHDIAIFVKDAYGCPYVPGSSVKGAIRTALLTSLIKANPALRKQYDSSLTHVKSPRNADRGLVHSALWVEQPDPCDESIKNDIMKYVHVSDSAPLSVEDLVFVKKYDKFSIKDAGTHKVDMGSLTDFNGNELNIYRECLRPKTKVNINVDVDERIDAFLPFPLDENGFLSIFETANNLYRERFLNCFDLAGTGAEEAQTAGSMANDGNCAYVYASGPFAGKRCRNRAIEGTMYCNTHKDAAGAASEQKTTSSAFYLGGGIDFDEKTIVNALFDSSKDSVNEISHILDSQRPTEADPRIHRRLLEDVKRAGYLPSDRMRAHYDRKGSLKKAKEDHRHWQEKAFGVSPHTLKMGIIGKQKYLMGKCELSVKERNV